MIQTEKSNLKSSTDILWHKGDCLELLRKIPSGSIQLVISSPPYNIGKEYESSQSLAHYVVFQQKVIRECHRVLTDKGSICWQVGNYVDDGEILPLDILMYRHFQDIGMKLRNRIIWTYDHGHHAKHRFSGRYETVMWFTKGDEYYFNLDAVRVPQKQPTKKFYRGPRKGELSCNPLGKNPGDVWRITNIKHGHPEKIIGGHPCQFPLALVERLVLSMSEEGQAVLDPFGGTASTLVGAVKLGRIAIGAEIDPKYHRIGKKRLGELTGIDILPSLNDFNSSFV